MIYAVVRLRGSISVKPEIRHTMKLLRLTKTNHCTLIPDNDYYRGMLQRIKDYVTWGEIETDVLKEMLSTRGELIGGAPLTEKSLKVLKDFEFQSFESLSEALISNKLKYNEIPHIKPLFRMHPPKGGYEGVKRHFSVGGSLGYRGDNINDLLRRMM